MPVRRKYLVVATVVLGLLIGLGISYSLLWPGITPPKECYPKIKLDYLYIKLFNVSSGAGSLSNNALLTYLAVIEVSNDCGFTIAPKYISLEIPEDIYLGTCGRGKEGTATVSVTISLSNRTSKLSSNHSSRVSGPSSYLVIYDSSLSRCVPAFSDVNGLLRHDYGIKYYPLSSEYFILPKHSIKLILTGTAPIPRLWVSRLNSWFDSGTYVIINFNGRGVDVRGYAEALLILKVKLKEVSKWEYVYGSIPEGLPLG